MKDLSFQNVAVGFAGISAGQVIQSEQCSLEVTGLLHGFDRSIEFLQQCHPRLVSRFLLQRLVQAGSRTAVVAVW